MNKELCFVIKNEKIYLEQILVDFNGYPIFYICKSEECYYIVLCVDIEESEYYVVASNLNEISRLLNQKIVMRDVFLQKKSYWSVTSGDTVDNDVVVSKPISEIDCSVLPTDGAKYEMFSEEVRSYLNRVEKMLYEDNSFEFVKKVDIYEENIIEADSIADDLSNMVNKYIEFLPTIKAKVNPPMLDSMPFDFFEKMTFTILNCHMHMVMGLELEYELSKKDSEIFYSVA